MYIHTPKGILVGTFNETQVLNQEDKKAVEDAQKDNPTYKYVDTEFVMEGIKIVGIKVFIKENF